MNRSIVQSQFGANAANYVTSKVHAKGASLGVLVDLLSPQAGWDVLDVATAAGHTAFAMAPHVRSVVASDITPEMLSEARKLGAEKGLTNVTFVEADAEALPFPDRNFDAVTCRIAPHHFSDPDRFVRQVHRVLKPGGLFGLVDNVSPDSVTTPGWSDGDLSAAASAYNAFEKLRDPSHGRCLTTTEWRDTLARAGFVIRSEALLEKDMHFRTWCRTMDVPPELYGRLSAMVEDGPPALQAYLRPAGPTGDFRFTLIEGVFVAVKGEADA